MTETRSLPNAVETQGGPAWAHHSTPVAFGSVRSAKRSFVGEKEKKT